MRVTSAALLLSGLAAQQVAATWNTNAPKYKTPQNNNNDCSDKQKGGFDFKDIPTGGFANYGGFNFGGGKGWTCADKFNKRDALTKRTFDSRCAKNTVSPKQPATFDCGNSKKEGFSVTHIDVSVEFDCNLEFHYKMPDNSVCKQVSPCKKEGTTVQNTQCGGAQGVEVYLGSHDQKDKESCEIGFHNIGFDCNPGYTPTPSKPASTPTPSKPATSNVYTPPVSKPASSAPASSGVYTPPVQSHPASSAPASSGVYTPPVQSHPVSSAPASSAPASSAPGSSNVYTPPASSKPVSSAPASSVPSQPASSAPASSGVYTPPASKPVSSAPASSGVYTPPAQSTPQGSTPVQSQPGYTPPAGPSGPSSAPVQSVPSSPVYSAPASSSTPAGATPSKPVSSPSYPTPSGPAGPGPNPPSCLPGCLNTWLEVKAECKDNTDFSCYCKNPDFTKSVIECVSAWATDSETQQALSYLVGICAPYVPQNPGIITNCPSTVTLGPSAPQTPKPSVPASSAVVSVPVVSTPAGSVLASKPASSAPVVTPAPSGPVVPPVVPVTTITYKTTVTVPCSNGAGSVIPGSSTVSTVSTAVTVPQVVFSTGPAPSAPAGASPSAPPVNLIPGTPAPVVASPTAPYAIPTSLGTVALPSGNSTKPTGPVQFPGAASSVSMSYISLFGAVLAFFAL